VKGCYENIVFGLPKGSFHRPKTEKMSNVAGTSLARNTGQVQNQHTTKCPVLDTRMQLGCGRLGGLQPEDEDREWMVDSG